MRKLLLAAATAMLAAPAVAQPAPPPIQLYRPQPQAPADGPKRPPRRLFISPSGEPFRGADGLQAWFARADADHDGTLTEAEFRADAERAFALYDADSNGVVDGFELQAYERERVPEITEMPIALEGGDRGPRHGWRRKDRGPDGEDRQAFRGAGATGASRFSLLDEPEPLLVADADVDGKVTRAEWARATGRRFGRLDRAAHGRLALPDLLPAQGKR